MSKPSPITHAWQFMTDAKASPWSKLLLAFTILYVISPIDLVPDVVVVLGWLDDLALAIAAATSLLIAMKRYRGRSDKPVRSTDHASSGVVETTGVEIG